MKSILLIFILFFTFPVFAVERGYTLDEELIYRVNFGRADDIKLLLEQGANPNARTNLGEAVLSVAAARDDDEAIGMVKALLDKGANPNIADNSGVYPIIAAVKNSRLEALKHLIAKGADFHVKSPKDETLLDIAKNSSDPELTKFVQEIFDNEAAFEASLRTPERFTGIIKSYALLSCEYQYWAYVLESKQYREREDEFNERLGRIKTGIAYNIGQIQKYYPRTPSADLQKISSAASQMIYDDLEALVSNSNRNSKGVGKEDDMVKRCKKISDLIKIDFPPSVLNAQ